MFDTTNDSTWTASDWDAAYGFERPADVSWDDEAAMYEQLAA